jgi:hypothetical protein
MNRQSRRKEPKKVVTEAVPDMRGKRPSKDTMERVQNEAYRLRLLGKAVEEIGELLGKEPKTIYEYLQKARARHIQELKTLDGRAGVAHQFQVLNYILDESLQAWERSKTVRKVKRASVQQKDIKIGLGEQVDGVLTTQQTGQTESEQVGDPVYLARAMEASKQIRELLGLDAPEVKRLLMGDDPLTKEGAGDVDHGHYSDQELYRLYQTAVSLGPRAGS